MSENSIEGVCYYQGTIPPEGIYYDDNWLSNGKEPSCLLAASAVIAYTIMLAIIGALFIH